jgi:hypothetical protein
MFPDNTALINFAIINRMDLLERLANGNGLKVAHRKKWIDADTLWGYALTLKGASRGAPPGVWDRPSFNKWLST